MEDFSSGQLALGVLVCICSAVTGAAMFFITYHILEDNVVNEKQQTIAWLLRACAAITIAAALLGLVSIATT